MDRHKLAYIALVITVIYGGLFIVVGEDSRQTYGVIGAVVVAICWITVGMLGKDKTDTR